MRYFNFYLKITAMLMAMTLITTPAHTQDNPQTLASLFGSKPKFLPVHQAFKVNARQEGETVVVHFDVTPEHYIYQNKLTLTVPEGVQAGKWQFSQTPTVIDDPQFGQVSVFEQSFSAKALLDGNHAIDDTLTIHWQGCAKAGLCYPPERTTLNIKLTPTPNQAKTDIKTESTNKQKVDKQKTDKEKTDKANNENTNQITSPSSDITDKANANQQQPTNQDKNTKADINPATADVVNGSDNQAKPSPSDNEATMAGVSDVDDTKTTENQVADNTSSVDVPSNTIPISTLNHTQANALSDPFGLGKRPVLAVFLLFLTGLGLAFTACVYPMIPIVANIVARSKTNSAMRGFFLTLAYGLGVATSYGILGAVIAWFGRSLGIIGWLQNPYVLVIFALMFVLFALQMLGVIRLSLPDGIKNKLSQVSSSADGHLGSMGGSFLVGLLSALVVSPCVSAPLGGALLTVSVLGNVALGFVALFALGFGLSVPLLFVGAMQGKFMPKAGAWLDWTKEFAGFMLFAVAILLLGRVWLSPWILGLWAMWLTALGLWAWRLKFLLAQALAVLSLVWSVLLLIGAAMGNSDVLRPLHFTHSVSSATTQNANADIKITTLSQLDEILTKTPKVLVDVTADWCIECRIMERDLFANRPTALADWQVVKLDISQTTEHSRAILARYGLFGPPALLYYRDGKLTHQQIGAVARHDFEQALSTH